MATVTRPSNALPNPGDDMLAEQVRDWFTNVLAFLEGTYIDEANVDTTGSDGIVGKSTAQTITGLKSLENAGAAGGGVRELLKIGIDPISGAAATGDGVRIKFYADDAGGSLGDRGYFDHILEVTTAGAVDSYYSFSTDVADTPTAGLTVGKVDTHLDIIGPSRTHTADASAYVAYFRAGGARTVPTGTAAVVATVRIDEPNITATGTVTEAVSVYIAAAPTEGAANYALHVASGAVLFAGTLEVTGALTFTGALSIDDTTDSTSGTTGSVHTDGGFGVVKNTYLGADLLLATGAVFNWAAGDVTFTHSAGKLTFGGDGAVEFDFANHEITNVDVNSGAVDGTTVGAASASTGAFTTLTASLATTLNGAVTIGDATGDALTFHPSAWTLTNAVTITGTWTDLGIVTTVDINGGTIDGTTVGASSATTGIFTTLAVSGTYLLPFLIGTRRLWEDATDDVFRVKTGSDPSSESDGNVLSEGELF